MATENALRVTLNTVRLIPFKLIEPFSITKGANFSFSLSTYLSGNHSLAALLAFKLVFTIHLENAFELNFSSISSYEPRLTSVSVTVLAFFENHKVKIIIILAIKRYKYGV